MKHLLIILILVSSVPQAQTFDGVKIDGTLNNAVMAFRAKGYTLQKSESTYASMKGKVAGNNIELYIFTTPKTHVVCKVVVYMDKERSWYSIKANYENLLELFEEKYGQPDKSYTVFKSPYYEGDGYEMLAISSEKAFYGSYWFNRNNLSMGLSISKFEQIQITYENDANMELNRRESELMISNSF
jgi:hypothetical protein